MSALGQKQACAAQKGMSALPPIATAKADIGARKFMSSLGQKRTSAVLFDHPVGSADRLGHKTRLPIRTVSSAGDKP
jgi:hypothetical protein